MLSTPAVARVKSVISSGNRGDLFQIETTVDQNILISRAPGRLDVMGGIADYTGSRVCQMPLAFEAVTALQKRTDGLVLCASAQQEVTIQIPIHQLAQMRPSELRPFFKSQGSWAGYIIGCVWWLLQHRTDQAHAPLTGGVSLYVDSDVPLGGGVSSSAAIEVATMNGLVALTQANLTPMQLAAACQQVENQVVGAPCGVMDQVASCMGQKDALLEILCQPTSDGSPAQVIGPIDIPQGYALVGIHSGIRHEVSGDPYTDTRVAAFMALKILRSAHLTTPPPDCLANIPAGPTWQTLRQQLPLEITGQTFLDQYGQTADTATVINPARTYHVRDAAEHHVLEMDRVTRFTHLLKEQPSNFSAIEQAGLLMSQSHTSYTRYAKLGHPLTDQLADMLLTNSSSNATNQPNHGVLGCRITGGGCGGTLAVLIKNQPQTLEYIQHIRHQYEMQTGRKTMFFTGTSDGATYRPVLRWNMSEL